MRFKVTLEMELDLEDTKKITDWLEENIQEDDITGFTINLLEMSDGTNEDTEEEKAA